MWLTHPLSILILVVPYVLRVRKHTSKPLRPLTLTDR